MDTLIFLGASKWNYYQNRSHYLALEFAKKGFNVFFIEEMPSIASKIRNIFWKKSFDNLNKDLPNNLKILTPPTCLTFFRSSLIPTLDKLQLLFWLKIIINKYELQNGILIYSLPYWRYLDVTKYLFQAKLSIFDIADENQMFSRNINSKKRLDFASDKLKIESDVIIYSSRIMKSQFNLNSKNSFYISNGLADNFLKFTTNNKYLKNSKKLIKIGFVGNIDSRTIDYELLKYISNNNKFQLNICGNLNSNLKIKLPNCILHGFLPQKDLIKFLQNCDVCIIPFKNNSTTNVINPLKLYEYFALGKPVVATYTEDLKYYAPLVYLAKNFIQFEKLILKAIKEDSIELCNKRINFAKKHLWISKASKLENIINNYLHD